MITVSPVSNLLVRSDILLAERTLYLPSVGAAFAVAALASRLAEGRRASAWRIAVPVGAAIGLLFLARTVDRNRSWADTHAMLTTLAIEHPESWLAPRREAIVARQAGDLPRSAAAYERAIEIAPDHDRLLVDAADVYDELGDARRAEELPSRTIELLPAHPQAYHRLAEQRLLRGEGRAAHAAALQGLARDADHPALWSLVSQSYVAKGDLEAAVGARCAAVARDSLSASGWTRLAELLDAMHRAGDAEVARRRARAVTGVLGGEE